MNAERPAAQRSKPEYVPVCRVCQEGRLAETKQGKWWCSRCQEYRDPVWCQVGEVLRGR